MNRAPGPSRTGVARSARLVGLVAAIAIVPLGLVACSDDDPDTAPEATAAVDEDFPGDALDATCARLEAADGDDQEAVAAALLDELMQRADAQLVINTMELAVVDRCPDWAEAVTAAIESRS